MQDYEPTEELTTLIMPEVKRAQDKIQETLLIKGLYQTGRDTVKAGRVYRARLDWEIADAALNDDEGDGLKDHVLSLMYAQVADDLDDVLQNGDTSQTSDPMYGMLDGSRKRGKALSDFSIISQALLIQYKENKKAYEYTLWLNFQAEWE